MRAQCFNGVVLHSGHRSAAVNRFVCSHAKRSGETGAHLSSLHLYGSMASRPLLTMKQMEATIEGVHDCIMNPLSWHVVRLTARPMNRAAHSGP